MKAKDILKKTFFNGCAVYTTFSALILVIYLLVGSDNEVIEPMRFFLLIPFSFLLAFGFAILKARELNAFIRVICNYVGIALNIFLFLYLPGATNESSGDVLAAFLIISILYGLIYAVAACISASRRKKKNVTKQYKEIFK